MIAKHDITTALFCLDSLELSIDLIQWISSTATLITSSGYELFQGRAHRLIQTSDGSASSTKLNLTYASPLRKLSGSSICDRKSSFGVHVILPGGVMPYLSVLPELPEINNRIPQSIHAMLH